MSFVMEGWSNIWAIIWIVGKLLFKRLCLGSCLDLAHFWHITPPDVSEITWCPFSCRPEESSADGGEEEFSGEGPGEGPIEVLLPSIKFLM